MTMLGVSIGHLTRRKVFRFIINLSKAGECIRNNMSKVATTDLCERTHKLDFINDYLAINLLTYLETTLVSPWKYSTRTKNVKVWLSRARIPLPFVCVRYRPGTLLRKARQLRENALGAIQARKAGRRPPLDALNAFLENVNCCHQGVLLPLRQIEDGIKLLRESL